MELPYCKFKYTLRKNSYKCTPTWSYYTLIFDDFQDVVIDIKIYTFCEKKNIIVEYEKKFDHSLFPVGVFNFMVQLFPKIMCDCECDSLCSMNIFLDRFQCLVEKLEKNCRNLCDIFSWDDIYKFKLDLSENKKIRLYLYSYNDKLGESSYHIWNISTDDKFRIRCDMVGESNVERFEI